MKTITKKQRQTFVDKLCARLIEVGAKKVKDTISTFRTFELETIVGKLTINVDTDNVHCYTMFSCFEDVARAKTKFSCNPYSGKYNTHVGSSKEMTPEKAVEICMIAIECTLPKELALKKAKDIYSKYKDYFDYDFMDRELSDYMATEYSLICVNEIIKSHTKVIINNDGTVVDTALDKYWVDVRDEIKLL